MATYTGTVAAPTRRRFQDSGLVDWMTTSDHKKIGILYLLTSGFFFLVGGIEAMIMRIQLTKANLQIISPELYDQLFTMHGTTMVFLVSMPILAGFG
ncbi:MAG TPA: cbb3-type cytochrome c oxidase subunit I, partial [Chloroflexota bacterium]